MKWYNSLVLSIICPPAAVYCRCGICADFIANICLTLLCYFPGLFHAVITVF
ncbi:hypothetical protein ENUP19_0018G0023 [Entamoeba nuttalli]|uniref:Plasma membrane proteolipid 3 n=2 Tax=Entamoeba nuttalli TaxID=412467 RepID=K2HZ18_ENTNP|nr:hypothetical protein ENU1_048800 [Entamoeba nuttalli P19]EKE41645.1 hypothetical protein ENU1_048800 [Entamoeba nuttalli P19]|eukprot:XP_008856016.1 hypothetical protein ENU1_048800 [Entamoeba nuttalli P19]